MSDFLLLPIVIRIPCCRAIGSGITGKMAMSMEDDMDIEMMYGQYKWNDSESAAVAIAAALWPGGIGVPAVENDTSVRPLWMRTSLFSRHPAVVLPYVCILSVAAIGGTIGNTLIIATMSRSTPRRHPRHRTCTTAVGNVFIVNLACADMIVTAIVNPIAIIGMPQCNVL